MDFSTVTNAQYEVLAALVVGAIMGKSMGFQTLYFNGLIVLAMLAPTNFIVLAFGWLMLCAATKWLSQWVKWL